MNITNLLFENPTVDFIKPDIAFEVIQEHWLTWAKQVNAKKFVIGISGGKDSTIVAYLATKIFGKENVIGVMMPNGTQTDINDSYKVINNLGISSYEINIKDSIDGLTKSMLSNGINISHTTLINLPCRIRMSTLYAVAQSLGAFVINTSNLSEDMVGYATIWGDTCGDYAPIQGLTVTEVLMLGDYLGVPYELCHKTPSDGLQASSDEDRLGVKYSEIDNYIRMDIVTPENKVLIENLYKKNKFKLDEIRLPGYKFDTLNNFIKYNMYNHILKEDANNESCSIY